MSNALSSSGVHRVFDIVVGANSVRNALPTQLCRFPIRSSAADFEVVKSSAGFTVQTSRQTMRMGYDAHTQSEVGVILNFEKIDLPETMALLRAQIRFNVSDSLKVVSPSYASMVCCNLAHLMHGLFHQVPSSQLGPFIVQIRTMNSTEFSWTTATEKDLSKFGSSSFVQWTLREETTGSTVWSPDVAALIQSSFADLASIRSVTFLITGGGLGEVSSFDRSAASAPTLELTVTHGTTLHRSRFVVIDLRFADCLFPLSHNSVQGANGRRDRSFH